jgi:hypothetical protein
MKKSPGPSREIFSSNPPYLNSMIRTCFHAAFEGLEKMSPEAGMGLYIDRIIGYFRKQTDK